LKERNVLPIDGKIGRNEPCPCGSGKKFEKCCFSLLKALPPRQVLGNGFYYNKLEYLQTAQPYDTIMVLENLTFLASNVENDGDVARALELFRILEPLAEQNGLLGELLRNFAIIFSDHPELGEEGLDIFRQLQSFYKDVDQKEWADACMGMADYLGFMGRSDECRDEYEKLIEMMPDHFFVRIKFAQFLERNNCIDEAVASYEYVFHKGIQVDEEYLKMAAWELRELAASHNIELDAWIKETIGDIL